ncbi:hypothetical protein AGDE_12477 [Angomonas deanei]|nr:hypothetical protein AGDE_12477 [Angomonas deanei]|eukprot:EPY24134.1 hypothetical protein AGDE_12477 [Angomonas deanei]
MKYPPLPAELKYVRIAGTHAALSAGTASIFVFAPCTLTFQEKGYYDTLSGKEKQAMLAEFSSIWRLSPDPKIATAYDEAELFFVIPTERARVNASCTYIGNVVYIMGGYLLNDTRSGNGKVWATDEVDSFDLNSKVYKSRVEYLRDAVLHPSVTSSSTAFVVGGGLTKPSVTGEVAISQKVSIFFPEGDRTPDESRPMCASALEDHLSETAVARLFPKTVSSEEKELLILGLDSCRMKMFGAVLLLANHNSSTMVSVDLRGRQASYFLSNGGTSSGDDSTSYVVSYAPIAAMFPHIVFEPVAPNSTDVESRTFLAVYQLSGVDIFFDCDTAAAGECVKQYYFSTRGLFRYFSSVETNSIVLPTPKLDREDYRKHNQTYGSLISFSMNSLSYGEYCLNSRKEKRCLIRLSSRKDCMGNAAGTADGLYAGASNEAINFTATGDSNPVYFCVGLPTTGELPNYNRKTIFDDDAYCRPSTMFTIADELLYSIRVEAGDVTTTTTTTVAPTPPSPGGSGSGTILIVICVILLFFSVAAGLETHLRRLWFAGSLSRERRLRAATVFTFERFPGGASAAAQHGRFL